MKKQTKHSNPKAVIGGTKVPLHLWPASATALGAVAMLDGSLKYGRSNYRVAGVRASTYVAACARHLTSWFEGEDNAADSSVPHLGHALACLAILVDAKATGVLNDDRMVYGGYDKLLKELEPLVAKMQKKYAGRSPRHFTIKDSPKRKRK